MSAKSSELQARSCGRCLPDGPGSPASAAANCPREFEVGNRVAPGPVDCPHEFEVGRSHAPARTNWPHEFEVGNYVAPGPVNCPHEFEVGRSHAPARANCPPEFEVGNRVAARPVNCPHEFEVGDQVAPGPVNCPHGFEVGRSHAPAHTNWPPVFHVADRAASSSPTLARWIAVSPATHDKLRRAVELASGDGVFEGRRQDLGQLLDRLLDCMIRRLERSRSRPALRPPRAPRGRRGVSVRHIAPDVRRVVWARDGGQCAFVGTGGRRCTGRRGLGFDLVQPIEDGGAWVHDNVRLLCRAHLEYVAKLRSDRCGAFEAGAERRCDARDEPSGARRAAPSAVGSAARSGEHAHDDHTDDPS